MNWIESTLLQAIRDIADKELKKVTEEREEVKEQIDYRKLPYVKINKIKNVIHTEFVKTEKQKQEEWRVRKENINKIKLPVFCSFQLPDGRPRRLGVLVNDGFKGEPELEEEGNIALFEVNKQTGMLIGDKIDSVRANETAKFGLENLIEMYKINIGKVEINFYE